MGCRRVGAPGTLLRSAVTADGVSLGRTLPGRGAWVCPGGDCMQVALQKGTLARALHLRREAISPQQGEQLVAACLAMSQTPTGETDVTDCGGREGAPQV